jgi:signal recognition particle GTPase
MKVEKDRKPGEQFISLLAVELVDLMGAAQVPLIRRTDGRPTIILMSGARDRDLFLP